MNIYKDIETRTNGEIYIGVVGPVRTGKSTFIKRFMELMVLPAIADDNNRKRAMDELAATVGCRKNRDDDRTKVYSEGSR